MLANLIREVARAGRVLHSLLRIARLDQGRPPERQPTDLMALLDDEVERAAALAPALAITSRHEGAAVDRVLLDADDVRELLANLLDNARRHAEERIVVTVTATEQELSVRVADDGPGVAEEARHRVFERFSSLDGHGGSGLGLPIARGIARAHGGDLVYDGEAFVLTLPRVHAGDQDYDGEEEAAARQTAPSRSSSDTRSGRLRQSYTSSTPSSSAE